MDNPSDEAIAEALRLHNYGGNLNAEIEAIKSKPEMHWGFHLLARTIDQRNKLVEALEKIARDRGGHMGEYHAECQYIAIDALTQIRSGQ